MAGWLYRDGDGKPEAGLGEKDTRVWDGWVNFPDGYYLGVWKPKTQVVFLPTVSPFGAYVVSLLPMYVGGQVIAGKVSLTLPILDECVAATAPSV